MGYFDTVINKWLQEQAGQQPMSSPVVGLCVESGCRYFSSLEFPNVVEAGLFVSHTGRSSLRYEVGIFQEGKGRWPCAAECCRRHG